MSDLPPDPQSQVPALEVRDLTKRFGSLIADDRVSLTVLPGEIHALLGENGAGKSTLMNMCYGLLQPDAGTILVNGTPVELSSPIAARRHGIGMVHQHFKLVPTLTVAENVFLGQELVTGHRSLAQREMIARVEEVSRRYRLEVHGSARVAELSVGFRQRVEIIKTLAFDARILILDEPTGVLTPQESERLFEILRAFAAEGRAIILITHKLGEARAVSDRFTVMRDGRRVATRATADASEAEIANLMVNRDVSFQRPERLSPQPVGTPARLLCNGLVVSDDAGRVQVRGADLAVGTGEICGIAGVEGNGQSELLEAISGVRRSAAGSVCIDGVEVTASSAAARRTLGVAHIPEDRLAAGVAPTMSVEDNIAAGYFDSDLFPHGILGHRDARAFSRYIISRYDVRGAGPQTIAGRLSGGNVQKVVVGRELERDPAVLLAAHPTRGLDVGATEFVHGRLREARDEGTAVVVLSADLAELMVLADRIVVMFEGHVNGEFDPLIHDVSEIGLAMIGAAQARSGPLGSETPAVPAAPEPAPPRGSRAVAERARAGGAQHGRERGASRRWLTALTAFVQPTIAVLTALVIGFAIIIAIGQNPFTAYRWFLLSSFENIPSFGAMLIQLTPLLLVGISVMIAFTGGIFNVGGEGQMYLGAFFGAVFASSFPSLPGALLITLALVVGMVAGALWALIPALLFAQYRVEIVVTTLMFSYVGQLLTAYLTSGPFRDPTAGATETKLLPAKAILPVLPGSFGANIGVLIGLGAVILVGLVLRMTRWGLQVRILGSSALFSGHVGVPVRRRTVEVMLASGALAGLAGAVASLGTEDRFLQGFSPGYGFLGLTVALLGRLSPTGLVAAGVVYASLEAGANTMQLNTGVPFPLVQILEGVVVVLMTAEGITRFRRRRRGASALEATLPPMAVAESLPQHALVYGEAGDE